MESKVADVNNALPMRYPFDWRGLEAFRYPRDVRGLPLVRVKGALRYNPITIAQFGLFSLQQYDRHRDERDAAQARACTGWLMAHLERWRGAIRAWVFDYDLDFYGPTAPWISGMAQGQGISLLLRCAAFFSEDEAAEPTHGAFQAFLYPVAEGGVVAHFPDGALVFEEFPTQPPSLVLNGHMFALLGIYDYARFWQSKEAADLFEVAVQGLKRNLERYDTGFWNRYDLHPTERLASPMYVKVHVRLLRILAELTGERAFRETAERWQSYLRSPVCRLRWLAQKILEKVRLRL